MLLLRANDGTNQQLPQLRQVACNAPWKSDRGGFIGCNPWRWVNVRTQTWGICTWRSAKQKTPRAEKATCVQSVWCTVGLNNTCLVQEVKNIRASGLQRGGKLRIHHMLLNANYLNAWKKKKRCNGIRHASWGQIHHVWILWSDTLNQSELL